MDVRDEGRRPRVAAETFMGVSKSRAIAYEILRRVAAEGAYAGELLHARLGGSVSGEDAGLVTEIVLGVLRWQRLLDWIVEKQTGTRTSRLDLEVLLALRVGIYQMRFLTAVPARAAVNESVELVKAARKRSAAGLVNAVLRRVEAKMDAEAMLLEGMSAAERLALAWSHPTWMVERWMARYGAERTRKMLEANNRAARRTVALPRGKRAETELPKLRAKGYVAEAGRWLRGAVDVKGGHRREKSEEGVAEEMFAVQDEASQMVARLVDMRAGQGVLDVCAAPGGKTMILAEAAGAGGLVVACDVHEHRLRAMRVPEEVVGGAAARVRRVALDATQELPFRTGFARVLVDAPCSGTGTLARNPEIRWRVTAKDLGELHARQVALVRRAMEVVAPGGRLVYSTCSMEAEENEEVMEEALAGRGEFKRVSGREALAGHLREGARVEELFDERGDFRTMPGEHGTDGFFGVVVERGVGSC